MVNIRTRAAAGAAAVLVALGALLVYAVRTGAFDRPPPGPDQFRVSDAVPEHALLDNVLAIVAERDKGGRNFSYVPRSRPPGLTDLGIADPSGTVTDAYRFDDPDAMASVQFAAEPTDICDDLRAEGRRCARRGTLPDPVEPALRHVSVYFSRPVDQGTQAWWSAVEFVPSGEAPWFTDLIAEAQAAPKA
jgi:hypothetical protein